MAWERRRNGNSYYYRSVRRYGRIEKEYYGSGYDGIAAAQMFAAINQARRKLTCFENQVRNQAKISARKLQQLLEFPLPVLAGLLAPTDYKLPELTDRQKRLIGKAKARELKQWGKTALYLQLVTMSGHSSTQLDQMKQLVESKVALPEGMHAHPILELYYEQLVLMNLKDASRTLKKSGHRARQTARYHYEYPGLYSRAYKARAAIDRVAMAVRKFPVSHVSPPETYSLDLKIQIKLNFPEKEIETENLYWPLYQHEHARRLSEAAEVSPSTSSPTEVNVEESEVPQAVDNDQTLENTATVDPRSEKLSILRIPRIDVDGLINQLPPFLHLTKAS